MCLVAYLQTKSLCAGRRKNSSAATVGLHHTSWSTFNVSLCLTALLACAYADNGYNDTNEYQRLQIPLLLSMAMSCAEAVAVAQDTACNKVPLLAQQT